VSDYPGYPQNPPGPGYQGQPGGYQDQPGGYPGQPGYQGQPGGYQDQRGGYQDQGYQGQPGYQDQQGYQDQPGYQGQPGYQDQQGYGYQGQPGGYPGQPAVPYANWGQRAGGYLFDAVPPAILAWIGISISTSVYIVFLLIGLIFTGYNRWYLGGTTGQSYGKRVLKLRLISEQTGQPIGPLMAFVRDICHILDSLACYVGWLFPLWDAKRQTFADKILNTIVIPSE
jgi:uncharacterized RDD family membrane protein YckC